MTIPVLRQLVPILWSWISGTPTTLSGYGITDAVDTSSTQTVAGTKTFSSAPWVNNIRILATSGTAGDVLWMDGANARWLFRKNNEAESGSNEGSNFDIFRYSDPGTSTLVARWDRATGVLDFKFAPTINGADLWHSGNFDPTYKQTWNATYSDFNSSVGTEAFYASGVVTNAPVASSLNWWGQTYMAFNSNNQFQMAGAITVTPGFYIRTKVGTTWGAWEQVLTTASSVDAATVQGFSTAEISTVSTVVRRNSSGDIQARLFRSEYDSTNASVGYIMTQIDTDSNNYIRPSTPAQVKTALALDSRDVPMNSGVVNLTATLGPTRLNTVVEKSNTTAYTYTIATTTGGVAGDAITFMNSGTAGNLTIAQGTSITIVRNGVTGNVTVAPGSMVTLVRSATTNKWVG